VDALERWTRLFQMASLVVSLIVLVAAVFVISNTVRLTMDAQSRVIEIQKLVGASNGFIRTPLLAGGVIQGVLGGALAMGGLAAAHAVFAPRLVGLIFFSPAQIAGFVLLCAVLGVLGGWAAMRKHLEL
jgi:cell division transport system permease protein